MPIDEMLAAVAVSIPFLLSGNAPRYILEVIEALIYAPYWDGKYRIAA